MPATERRWASYKDLKAYAGISEWTARRMAERGELRLYRVGPRLVRFDLNEVDALLKDEDAS
jgi:excisionase family DNA binding protein